MTMLSHISVDNFRSLYNFDLDLHPFTVLIGRNDAGKSNVLRALRLLLDNRATEQINRYDWSKLAKARKFPREITITGTMDAIQPLELRRTVVLTRESVATSTLEIKTPDNDWRLVSDTDDPLIPSFYYFRPRTGLLEDALNPDIENYIFSLVKDWIPEEQRNERLLDKLMRIYDPKNSNLGAYVRFIQDEVEKRLTQAFPLDFPVLTLNPEFRGGGNARNLLLIRELGPEDKEARFRLPLNYHGTALISITAILLSIAVLREYHRQNYNGKPLIVGIEEPEVHLHTQAQRTLLTQLKEVSHSVQVLITTHSPVFVDRTQPENVVVLRRATIEDEVRAQAKQAQKSNQRGLSKRSRTKQHYLKAGTTLPILNNYAENWKDVVEVLDIRLSDVLMAGEIALVVEGESEAILLPAMAEALTDAGQIAIDFGRVVFVPGKGTNLPKLVEFFQLLKAKVVAVLDNDQGGNAIKRNLEKLPVPIQAIFMPDNQIISSLISPMDQLQECELEDLLDGRILLEAFNEIYSGRDNYEFLPLNYSDFKGKQTKLFDQSCKNGWGWIATIRSLVMEKAKSSEVKQAFGPRDSFPKHALARTAARYIREGKLAVPDFYKSVLVQLHQLLNIWG